MGRRKLMFLIDIAKSAFIVFTGSVLLIIAIRACRNETDPKLKNCYQLLAFAVILVVIGSFLIVKELQEQGYIVVNTEGLVWYMMQGFVIILFCVILLGAGILIYRKGVAENDTLDMEIEGYVCGKDMMIGTPVFPGYGRLIILYADPYDGSMHKYHLSHDLRLKKYPVGTPYRLMYSRTKHQVYEKESNQTNRRIGVMIFGMGMVTMIAVLIRLGYLAVVHFM